MTGAAIPPGVVAEAAAAAKGWLRAAGTDDDTVIAALAASALALAEAFCRRTWITRDFAETVAGTGAWQPLSAQPVAAIGVPERGHVPLCVTDYAIDIDACGVGWVRLAGEGPAAVAYRAGEAIDWASLPPPVAQGVAMLVAHLFDDRAGAAEPPAAVAALWRPWRRLALAAERRR